MRKAVVRLQVRAALPHRPRSPQPVLRLVAFNAAPHAPSAIEPPINQLAARFSNTSRWLLTDHAANPDKPINAVTATTISRHGRERNTHVN
jgi:hypothetical protein